MPLHLSDIAYLLTLIVLFAVTYRVFFWAFPKFFRVPTAHFGGASVRSILYLVIFSVLAYVISYAIPGYDLGNRFLHAFGGGFLAMLMCFFVVRDTKLPLTKFQFFVFSLLVVTALGVGNELLEFLCQSITGVIFSPTATDTWLDLTSNTVGALIACACLLPWL